MDFQITETQRRLRDTAREFARDRVRVVAQEMEGHSDPSETYPRTLVEEASELGLRTITLPEDLGGVDADCLTEVIVLEEISYGDPGFGMTIQHGWREGRMLYDFGSEEQRDRYLSEFVNDPSYVTSICITEDHFGSDKVRPASPQDDPAAGVRTKAVKDGDHWVIDGRKRWITNGNVSRLLFVVARTDTAVPWREGISVFLVPSDASGFRVGTVEDKLGLRLNQNAELIFDSCVVPESNLLGSLNRGAEVLHRYRNGGTVKEAAKSLGCARAALEAAEAYSRTRVQGGRLIGEHQTVATSLAGIATEIEAARSLAWRAACAIDEGMPSAYPLSTMAGVAATNVVVKAAVRALELHGAAGIRVGTAAELNLRNAVCQMHAPAANDVMLEVLHQWLSAQHGEYAAPAGEDDASAPHGGVGLL